MAVQTSTRVAPFGALSIFRAVSAIESGMNLLKGWNDARRTTAALNALSNHELEDIGLSRGDIEAVAQRSSFR